MHNKKGTKINRLTSPSPPCPGRMGRAVPRRRRRRVALLPPKDVALFLPKEQGKETEAVSMCIIKRE